MIENGYGIMPNVILWDKKLKDKEKLFYCLISSLCAINGYCRANNAYFGEKMGITKANASRRINTLEKKGYITIESKGSKRLIRLEGKYCQKRQYPLPETAISLAEIDNVGLPKSTTPLAENGNHNNITNTINNKQINKTNIIDISNFQEKVQEFEKLYGAKMIIDFTEYWTETNSRGKQRRQGEKFFDISRRLSTRYQNSTKYSSVAKKPDNVKSMSKEEMLTTNPNHLPIREREKYENHMRWVYKQLDQGKYVEDHDLPINMRGGKKSFLQSL